MRAARDSALALSLTEGGIRTFIDSWYQQPLFSSLKSHPVFKEVLLRRTQPSEARVADIARVLSDASSGRQPYLGDEISQSQSRILFMAGSLDEKFVAAGEDMAAKGGSLAEFVSLSEAGHALHIERAESVIQTIGRWLRSRQP